MTFTVKHVPYSPSAPYSVIAIDLNGRETFVGTYHSREAAEDAADERQDAYDHGTNYFINGDE